MGTNQMRCSRCGHWFNFIGGIRCEKCQAEWQAERAAEDRADEDRAIAEAARKAGMVDEQGKFRKVIGTLLVTADDVIVLPGAKVWPRADFWIFNDEFNENWTAEEESAEVKLTLSGDAELDDWNVTTCYSTPEAAREAAEAARKKAHEPD